MTKTVGRLGNLGLLKESTAGTIQTTYNLPIPINSISFDSKTASAREEEGLGRIEDSDSNLVTNKFAEGDFNFDVNDTSIGAILSSIIGNSPTTTGSGPYVHTFSEANNSTPKSFSIVYDNPTMDIAEVFPYGVVDTLELEVEPEGIVKGTASFKSRVARDWTTFGVLSWGAGYQALFGTFSAQKFLHQHLSFKLADTIGGLAAASNLSLKKLNIKISRNSDFDNVTGTVEPEAILGHELSVEGEITLNKESNTYRNYMLNGTYKAMEINLLRSASSSLKFQLPRVDFTEWEQDRALNDIVTQTIQFKANYDTANALSAISTCELTNSFSLASNYY